MKAFLDALRTSLKELEAFVFNIGLLAYRFQYVHTTEVKAAFSELLLERCVVIQGRRYSFVLRFNDDHTVFTLNWFRAFAVGNREN